MTGVIKIMYDSPEAARPVTLHDESGKKIKDGYISADGTFFNKEETARYHCHTHRICDCGKEMRRGRTICDECQAIKINKEYDAMPYKKWDGKDYLTLYLKDVFFKDEEAVIDYCNTHEINGSSLQLVICNPNYLSEVEQDIWEDIAPEDVDDFLPKEVEDALTYLNVAIKNAAPVSWSAGSFRTSYGYEYKPETKNSIEEGGS